MEQKTPRRFVCALRRALVYLLIFFLALVAGAAAWLYWRTHVCLPQLDGTVQVPELKARVQVRRDAQGVPHIRAQSLDDLLFAQGYVTAQDRLWQMDLSRRLAYGELSEIFGQRALKLDIENRTLGFRQASERAVGELSPESRSMLEAYTRGVNAFISTHQDRLPIEFLMLRYRPRPWQAKDSFAVALNMAKTLNTSWPDELMRERVCAKVGRELCTDLFPDHSPLDRPVAEPLLAPGISSQHSQGAALEPLAGLDPVLGALAPPPDSSRADLGSNNWVVNGAHTQSGKPLLANDPHLGHGVPSVWYLIHLKAPGLNVSGASLPGLPVVTIGHNERIAWGVTNTGPDVQDLYVESFNFRDPRGYLHNGQWVEATVREEVIKVRGGRDYSFTVMTTRHGPVISHEGARELALRWTALEPGGLRFPFLKINQAQNWQEFTAALRDYAGPMQNFVYADVDGNIGFYAAGWVPIRNQGDGTVPSSGSSEDHDWIGHIPFESLPHAYNPASGIIATANGRIVPDGYPYFITSMWASPYRTARIYQLLEAGARLTVADMLRIQTDIRPLDDVWLAKQLLAAAAKRPAQGTDAQYALSLLASWDGEARADSAATLVCQVTRRALRERILKAKLGDDLSGYRWPMSTVFLENVLTDGWTRWLPPGDADFNVTLTRSLEEGVRRIPQLVGSRDHAAWRWGDTIPLTFQHPLGGLRFFGRWLNVGPFPQAGTGNTVKQTTPSHGVSMRLAVDFSNFDNSVQNITLGQSGQVFSPHYRDQFEAWYNGRSYPMLFSDEAVEKGAIHRLTLEPLKQP
jgi:penicillin amidase